ncbi:hypothetical protein QL285_071786 [Trifolium repens]|jgi:hypothetical protein|nr:hypothetical protein QL285_071786 [Trifolium repens]
MANKSLNVTLILMILLYMVVTTAGDAELDADDGEIIDGNVTLSDCKQQCMLICMKIKLSQISLCQDACSPACKQLQGKGSLFRRPKKKE